MPNERNIERGLIWYDAARWRAERISEQTGVPIRSVCGILSALSVGVVWGTTVSQTEALCQGLAQNVSTYGAQLGKALRILGGAHPWRVLGKRAYKTRAFYLNILLPQRDTLVTIDRHILRAYSVNWPNLTAKRYRLLSDRIRQDAYDNVMLPHQWQAAVWLEQKGVK